MPDDTITIALEGDVSLGDFAATMRRFTLLVNALTSDIAGDVSVLWDVAELYASSAVATIVSESEDTDTVDRIVSAYAAVGEATEQGRPIPYKKDIFDTHYRSQKL